MGLPESRESRDRSFLSGSVVDDLWEQAAGGVALDIRAGIIVTDDPATCIGKPKPNVVTDDPATCGQKPKPNVVTDDPAQCGKKPKYHHT